MRRKLFNLAAVVSLVLCVTSAALWVRSRALGRSDELLYMTGRRAYYAFSVGGKLFLSYHTYDKTYPAKPLTWTRGNALDFTPAPPLGWNLLGFSYRPFRQAGTGNAEYLLVLPYLPLSVVCAIAPAWWSIGAWRSRRQRRKDCCSVCGYDLRATPERCPECGAVPASVK